MKNKKAFFKMILKFLVITLIVGYCASYIMDTTYSSSNVVAPDVIITYNSNGSRSETGSLFGNELWYPGKAKDGVIRIHNEYKTFDLDRIGVDITNFIKNNIRTSTTTLSDNSVAYNSFLNHMKLSITAGKQNILDFRERSIIENKSFGELLLVSNDPNKNGIALDASKKITIARRDFIDLKYTLVMDEESGPELQNITADVSFILNASEVVIHDDDDPIFNPPIYNPPATPDEPTNPVLVDIPPDLIPLGGNHWAHDCIIALLEAGIIQGYPDGTIKPDQSITRAEVAILLAKALEIEPEKRLLSGYIDPLPAWAKGYIIALSDRGIYKGYPFRIFKPNNNISREEMVAVLIRGFEKSMAQNLQLGFIDKEDIGEWAEEYVITGVATKILEGYPDKSFRPKQEITRAETFTIICKLLGLHEQHNTN